MIPIRLSATAHFPATSFVAVLAVVCASALMDVMGGGLKPYEMQTARAAFAYVVGEASADELSGPAPYYPSWREPRAPAPPMVYAASSEENDVLLGGLGAQVGRFKPRELRVDQSSEACPPAVQLVGTQAPMSSGGAAT